MDRTANAGTTSKWSVGSNPTLSAFPTARWVSPAGLLLFSSSEASRLATHGSLCCNCVTAGVNRS